MRSIDTTTGTGASPNYTPFAGKKKALVTISFFDDPENELTEGFANSALSAARGVLQIGGFEVSDARFVHVLDSGDDPSAVVALSLNVARDVEETEPASA